MRLVTVTRTYFSPMVDDYVVETYTYDLDTDIAEQVESDDRA